MYHFFTSEDFLDTTLPARVNTYTVGVGQGAVLQLNAEYQHILTTGLRTCVAFALINPADQSALLIHFFHPQQIKNDLLSTVACYIESTHLTDMGIKCLVVGGRAFNANSEEMCEMLIKYATKELLSSANNIKIQIQAPLVAEDNETLSLFIDLETADSRVVLDKNQVLGKDTDIPIDKIDFINLIRKSLLLL